MLMTYTDAKGNNYPVIIKTTEKPTTEPEVVEQLFAVFAKAN